MKINPNDKYAPKFDMGQLVCTPGINQAMLEERLKKSEFVVFLLRHLQGDWGDCSPADAKANDDALKHEARVFSVYHAESGLKVWVITEADRSSTCMLLPDEY